MMISFTAVLVVAKKKYIYYDKNFFLPFTEL